MGFLDWVLGRSKRDAIKLLENAGEMLRICIFGRLYKRYIPQLGDREAKFLAAAVFNEVVLEEPVGREASDYLVANKVRIWTEAKKLRSDPVIAEALSYLYAAQTLYDAYATRNPFSERARALGARATELSNNIPNTCDICGSADANDGIRAIASYADQFRREYDV